MTQTVSLSARLRALELDVAELNELRAQRAELNRRIEAGEDAERLLASVEFLLLPLLDGEQPEAEEAVDDTPAQEEIAGPRIDDEPREVTPEEFKQQIHESEVQEPAPTDAADDQEPEAEEAAPFQLSAGVRVLEWVSALPYGQEFFAPECASATGLAIGTVKGHLGSLKERGQVGVLEGTGLPGVPSKFVRPRPTPPQQVAPVQEAQPVDPLAGELPLTPIPAKLSTDECSLFDVLRRVPSGLGQRSLGARLNWGNSRVERTLQSLAKWGYVGRNDDLYRVIPEELREGAAAD